MVVTLKLTSKLLDLRLFSYLTWTVIIQKPEWTACIDRVDRALVPTVFEVSPRITEILSLKKILPFPQLLQNAANLVNVRVFIRLRVSPQANHDTHGGMRHLEEEKDSSRRGEEGDRPLKGLLKSNRLLRSSPTPQMTFDTSPPLCFLIPTFSLLTKGLLAVKTSHDSKLEEDFIRRWTRFPLNNFQPWWQSCITETNFEFSVS